MSASSLILKIFQVHSALRVHLSVSTCLRCTSILELPGISLDLMEKIDSSAHLLLTDLFKEVLKK